MKSCKNCGSPVHGYSDYCGGIACESSRHPETSDDWQTFTKTWPNAGWQLWQVILALRDMKEQWPDLYEKNFDGIADSLDSVFAKFESLEE